MTHHLNIDVETFSSVPINKAGLYKYVQSPDFEILLFGYSLDGAPPVVLDFTQNAWIPKNIWMALRNQDVIKHAYNAAFEITCLSRWLMLTPKQSRDWLSQWRDSMLHSLYCGYPASLDAAGKALGLPEDKRKLTTGKALIKLFCTPHTPTDRDPRTRIRPQDEPEKWELFKTYNAGDVTAEQEIERRLSPFPVPDDIQHQWETDLRINSRGVALDLDLIHGALDCDETVTQPLMAEARKLTELDNPNSMAQIKGWLQGRGYEVSTLRKDDVTALLEGDDLDPAARRVLEIRQELCKTSTKKYVAMQGAACADGRIRGTLQFYGANRTGRWCLTGDHEVLTSTGWKRLDKWLGGEIACWAPATEYISFQKANILSFDYSGEMYALTGQRIEQISTPDHKMAVLQKDGTWRPETVDYASKHRFTIPFTGRRLVGQSAEPDKLRVLIMTQADGHYVHEGDVRYHFKKIRKVERCKHLLRKCQIPFIETTHTDETTNIVVKNRCMPIWLRQFQNKTFGYWLLDESADVIFDELPYWDGYNCGPNSIQYSTTVKQNAEIIQAAAALSGRSATVLMKRRQDKSWNDTYVVNIWNTPGHGTAIRTEQVTKTQFSGKVYCAETQTGYFLVRRNGKVWVTGNSGRMIQPQNLPRTYIHGGMLDLARELVKTRKVDALKLIYGSVPDTLSQLIRTALIPTPGHTFVDADFSAIEARVVAWLARQQDTLDVFRRGEDIYCATASRMFGVPVKKHGVNGELRQKGKIATLALGYGGGTGALVKMGALKQGLTEDELPDIVRRWRESNPRIRDLWYKVENAAVGCVRTGRPQGVNGLLIAMEGDQSTNQWFMTITLPGGRKLYYARPFVTPGQYSSDALHYWGMNQTTHKWEVVDTWGGKCVENCVQAIARDCLAENIERLEAAGYPIVFHIHDEVVLDCPPEKANLDDVIKSMSQPISWAPGLPLSADGWTGSYFTKD